MRGPRERGALGGIANAEFAGVQDLRPSAYFRHSTAVLLPSWTGDV